MCFMSNAVSFRGDQVTEVCMRCLMERVDCVVWVCCCGCCDCFLFTGGVVVAIAIIYSIDMIKCLTI